ncbi:MAG: GspMb/PilO family protein [Anaerohalosphaeraceae bacterium]
METKIKLNRYLIITAAVWIVSVIALGAGYLLFGAPQKSELVQLKNQCAESHSDLEKAQMAAQEKTKARQQQECQDVEQLLSSLSAQHDAVTELVFEIGRIATNELRLIEFSSKNHKQNSYSTVGDSPLVDEVWLKVDFRATFEQFAQFLNRLECHHPVVFVEEVSFRRGANDADGHQISLQLSFLTASGAANKKVATATH